MAESYWVEGVYNKQDLIRTISISFQPHIPFTEAYEMKLQGQGGGAFGSDPARLGYFRFSPRDIEGSTNPKADARDYPMKHKAAIYNAEGGPFPRAIQMSMAHNRREQALDKIPEGEAGENESLLGAQLASLLKGDNMLTGEEFRTSQSSLENYKIDGRTVRDKNELELHMINEYLDSTIGGGGAPVIDPHDTQINNDYSGRSGQTFDMDMKGRKSISSFFQNQNQVAIGSNTRFLEISNEMGGGKHALGAIDIRNKKIKTVRTKWAKFIKKKLDKWNKLMETEWKNLKLSADEMTGMTASGASKLRDKFKKGTSAGTANYEIRQVLDRYIKNNFNPYLTQHQFKFGIGVFQRMPHWDDAKGFQLSTHNIGARIMIFQNATSLTQAIVNAAVEKFPQYESKILGKHTSVKVRAANTAYATKANLSVTGKYMEARTKLDASNVKLRLNKVGADGQPTTVHKVSLDIAKKMEKDLLARYQARTPQFKEWYEKMMRASNSLTRSWFNNLLNVRGQGPSDTVKAGKNNSPASISKEFMYGKDWAGPRKKYMGVWNPPNVDTWKGVKGMRGYNMSLSPMMESRRKGTKW